MGIMRIGQWLLVGAFLGIVPLVGCDSVPVGDIVDIIDVIDGVDGVDGVIPDEDLFEFEVFATNTGGASGFALRPSDNAVFILNKDGLFGPIQKDDDVSTMAPIGATTLADPEFFDLEQSSLVMAITNSGEFWIASPCCSTMAIVGPEGGEAEAFIGLLEGPDQGNPSNVKPETMVIVPEGFDGPQIDPGNLLVGRESTFSDLSAINVEGNREVVPRIDNPDELENPDDFLNRLSHHLAFGPDGTLYGSRGLAGALLSGMQTIDTDGRPHELPGTLGLSADSFVVLDNGDIVISGAYHPQGESRILGILLWSADTQSITMGLPISDSEYSEDNELVIAPDGTIYMALPDRNEIVRVIDKR
ncbi:MAG: hypothetical protein KAV82_08170 [Phycisphaerae bacterium]|nr:hypothetical protein [Phycisphaerae bacterium]